MMLAQSRKRRILDLATDVATPVLAMGFAVFYIAHTYDLPRESKVFPHTAAVIVILFSVFLLSREIRAAVKTRDFAGPEGGASRMPLVYVLSVGFVAAFNLVGFVAASAGYLLVSQILLRRRWLPSALIAAGVTACLYFVFVTLLGVRL